MGCAISAEQYAEETSHQKTPSAQVPCQPQPELPSSRPSLPSGAAQPLTTASSHSIENTNSNSTGGHNPSPPFASPASSFAEQHEVQELLPLHLAESGPRCTDRVLPSAVLDDGIRVIEDHSSDEGQEAHEGSPMTPVRATRPAARPDMDAHSPQQSWTRMDSVKASTAAAVTLDSSPQPSGRERVKGGQFDYDLKALQPGPPGAASKPPSNLSKWTGQAECTLTISDDEDEEDDEEVIEFDMVRWKRFYHWNRKKPQALLRFLWRRFDARKWSLFCCSYAPQDALFMGYQGENLIHGLACRLETSLGDSSMGGDLFGVLHTLSDPSCEVYKVVGVFLVRGAGGSPPQQLAAHLAPYDWQLAKADTQDPLVRTFVGNLVASLSPVHHSLGQQPWRILHSREVL